MKAYNGLSICIPIFETLYMARLKGTTIVRSTAFSNIPKANKLLNNGKGSLRGKSYPNKLKSGYEGKNKDRTISDFASAPPNTPIWNKRYTKIKIKTVEISNRNR